MAKKLTNTVRVVREGGMTDDELKQALAVPEDHHVMRGVIEVLDRLDASYDDSFCAIGVTPQIRSDAGILKAAVRDVRLAIQDWNRASQKDDHGQASS